MRPLILPSAIMPDTKGRRYRQRFVKVIVALSELHGLYTTTFSGGPEQPGKFLFASSCSSRSSGFSRIRDRNVKAKRGPRSAIVAAVKGGAIVAAAGRRIDPDDATVTRFPLAAIRQTRRRIDDTLVRCGPLRSSPRPHAVPTFWHSRRPPISACGDASCCHSIPELFRETSVTDRPGDWGPVFDETLLQLRAAGDVVLLDESPDDAGYAAAGEAILDEAERIAGENGDRLVAMIVWDGRPRTGVDLTARFRESAARRGFEIVDVPTLGSHG